MEIIVFVIVMSACISLIIAAYGKQKEKHSKMQEWMKEVKRQNDKNN